MTIALPLRIALLAILIAPVAAEDALGDAWVRGFVGVWLPSLGGEVFADDGAIEGSEFSAEDFELDDRELGLIAEGVISLPLFFDVAGGLFTYGVDGSDTVAAKTFNGEVFTGEVTTDISITDVFVEGAWRPIDTGLVSLSFGLAVHLVDAQTEVTSNLGQQEEIDEQFVIPALAVRGVVEPYGGWAVEARAHAVSVEVGDVDATYYDILAHVSYRPIDWVGVSVGYRFVSYDFDIDLSGDAQFRADLSLDGPFVGATFAF